jgi:proteasome assembly chaperone (PAC2) family protein
MIDLIKIRARPRLNSPNMVAAWPGIANVATIAVSYLQKRLEFKDLGELDAAHFFDPIGITVRDNVIEEPQFPQSKFYYWKNRPGKSDLILFIGDDQPAVKAYDLAGCVLDMAVRFKVSRIYTCAAAITRMHHTEMPKAWGVVTTRQLTAELERHDLMQRGNLQIAGLNGLLLGVAKERGIDAMCLLGEVPAHAARIQNPMAALAILRVLTRMLDIKVDLLELEQIASQAKDRLKQMAAEAMGEYIDLFTEPIWEQGENEEEDED